MVIGGLLGITHMVVLPQFQVRLVNANREPDPALSIRDAPSIQALSILFSKALKHMLS